MRFFGSNIKKGAPVSTEGFTDGILRMAHALENLSIFGGKISWSSDGVPKIIAPSIAGMSAMPYEVVSESGDYLMCARVASLNATQQPVPVTPEEGQAETLVKVWKPWLLRQTPFDGLTRDGIGYVYDSAAIRVATPTGGDEEDAETQYVTPYYSARDGGQAGELLYAIPVTPSEEAGDMIDINTAGRCWATGDEVEEA